MGDTAPPVEIREGKSDLDCSISSSQQVSTSEQLSSSAADELTESYDIAEEAAHSATLPHDQDGSVHESFSKLPHENSRDISPMLVDSSTYHDHSEHEHTMPGSAGGLNESDTNTLEEALETLAFPAQEEKLGKEEASVGAYDISDVTSGDSNMQINNLSTKANTTAEAQNDALIGSNPSSALDWIIKRSADHDGKIEHWKPPLEQVAKPVNPYRGLVDTAAPFESVREAVSKFGGITDWKAHKAQILARRKLVLVELEKVKREIPQIKQEAELAEASKEQVLEDLMNAQKLVEELKHELERAQTEETQARQDSELAQLRVEEVERGVKDEGSVAAKAQLEVARTRHDKAITELKSANDELRLLQEQYATLVQEMHLAVNRAEESASAAKDIEKKVEELMLELITLKESLESAHAAHHEAEEHRMGSALVKEQDCLTWEKELKQAQDELRHLEQNVSSTEDLKSKLETALGTLANLNAELAAYMEVKLGEAVKSTGAEDVGAFNKKALASTRQELEDVKARVESAKNEVNCFRVASSSLETELGKERAALAELQQREGMASIVVLSLESELNRTKQDLELVRMKEKETREKMAELPRLLQEAALEAEEAKSAALLAQEELRLAKEEHEQAKASLTTLEIRLRATLKEIEATKASESLALAAIKALKESAEARTLSGDSPRGVTLPVGEYNMLSKRAHDAEQHAREQIAAALRQVELAKESESTRMARLQQAETELDQKAAALGAALDKADHANEGKLAAEHELRKRRAENERRRKANDMPAKSAVSPVPSPRRSTNRTPDKEDGIGDLKLYGDVRSTADERIATRKLRKRAFLRRMAMLLARKKTQK